MPPKKATTAAPKAKASSSTPAHASYRDMIKEAIMALKERNGSSRSALKKYILANNKNVTPGPTFDGQFNRAVKAGADKEEFALPKGPSGSVKLNKKPSVAAPKAEKPAAAKKPAAVKKTATKTKTEAPKKAAAPKKTATKTKTAPKKTAEPKTKAAAKPKAKANTGTKRAKKTPTAAPAVIEEKKILGKTKSGRVTKNKAEPAPAKASAKKTPKKAAPKKTASAKKATPKKADVSAAAE